MHGVNTTMAKAYLDHFHQDKVSIMASLIENETWGQTEIPVEFQRLVDQLAAKKLGLGDETPPDTPTRVDDAGDDGDLDQDTEGAPVAPPPGSSASPLSAADGGPGQMPGVMATQTSKKCIVLAQQRFYIVTCTLMFLKFLGEYLNFLDLFPLFEPEVARRLTELIQVFNSRTCQMILGGGALTTAGLKNLKTKHLAFASQSLGLVMVLIPSIKERLRLKTQAKQQQVFLGELDRVLKDVTDHQNEIHAKLGSVIPSRLETSKVTFRNTDWSDTSTKTPTPFSKNLTTDVTALNKVLERYLPKEIYKGIMEHVFLEINKTLEGEILSMELDTQEGKDRLDVEVQFLAGSLESLGKLGGIGDRLQQIARSMPVVARRKEPRPADDPRRKDSRTIEETLRKSWFG